MSRMTPIVNFYAGSPLDRIGNARRDDAYIARLLSHPRSRFILLRNGQPLIAGDEAPRAALLALHEAGLSVEGLELRDWAFLGLHDGDAVFTVALAEDEALPGDLAARFEPLRGIAASLPAGDAAMLAHSAATLHWRQNHRFCGICGQACVPGQAGHVMSCTGCGKQHFPRTDPAVIMLVTHGDRALLARSPRFLERRVLSTLAGFVEPGESLEEAVAREVCEEVGVRLRGIRYHSSQPWPYPGLVMIGFTAEAEDDALTLDPEEIVEAHWLTRDQLRDPQDFALPGDTSIARRLIDDWLRAG